MIDGSVKDIKMWLPRKCSSITHQEAREKQSKNTEHAFLSVFTFPDIFSLFFPFSHAWLLRMQIGAGMLVLGLNRNEKKKPSSNLLCFMYSFCCNPACKEVAEWPSENCSAWQCKGEKNLQGVCASVKLCALYLCTCTGYILMCNSCTWECKWYSSIRNRGTVF